jgi:hypothetical protein
MQSIVSALIALAALAGIAAPAPVHDASSSYGRRQQSGGSRALRREDP